MLRPTLFTALLLAAGFGAYSVAQQEGRGLEAKFHKFDKNGDGKLTPDEVPGELFSKLDLDKNGEVTLEEARKAVLTGVLEIAKGGKNGKGSKGDTISEGDPAPFANRVFDFLDKNHDGKLTREETNQPAWFDKLDRNQDGVITREEVVAVAAQVKKFALENGMNFDAPAEPVKPVAQGPKHLKAGDVGVGRQVPDAAFTDLTGKARTLSDTSGEKGLVVAFTSTSCPVSKRYAPSLGRLEKDLQTKGFALLVVDPLKTDKPEDMKAQGFSCAYAHDISGTLATALDARTTTEVFLLDRTRTLLYRGALDDQYGVAYNRDAPLNSYLLDAVTDTLAGTHPRVAATEAPGCELDRPATPAVASKDVTYHRDVARILAQNCVACHHDGGIAPFTLDSPDEVKDRAKTIKRVVTEGAMPPWFAKDEVPNRWANDHSLSARDKADLLAWIESSDRPMGDVADAPTPQVFPKGGWTLGQPDKVYEFVKPVAVKAEGKMPYVNVQVVTNETEDRWIQGIEVQPGDRQVVHHVIVSIRTGKKSEEVAAHEGFFAAYVPGNAGDVFPSGFARKLPAGAVLNFQMHYTPNGKATEDKTRIGFRWATQPPKFEMKVASVPNTRLNIPPGEANHIETAQRPAPYDMTVVGFTPHMHVRGKAFRYEVVQSSGNQVLLDIPRYDFNWQLIYNLNEPLFVPRGTVMKVTATFDNSAGNKANPDPTKTVHWGQQTEDEMMIGYISYYVPVSNGSATAAR